MNLKSKCNDSKTRIFFISLTLTVQMIDFIWKEKRICYTEDQANETKEEVIFFLSWGETQ